MEVRLIFRKMSRGDDGGRKNNVRGYGSRQFDVSSSWVRLGSNSPYLDGSGPLGCHCKVIRGKVCYGPRLPKSASIEDQLWFELITKEVNVRNARLQLYGPLSPISFDG